MVTTITKTVGATGRDYSTLTAAEADILTILSDAGHGTDMVADDVRIVFELYIDGQGTSQTFTDVLVVDAAVTTDATRNITFRAADSDRHDGTRESGVRIKPTAGGITFIIKLNHTRLEGLEICTGSGASDECVRVSVDEVGVVIEDCIMEPHDLASPGASQNGVYLANWSAGSAAAPIVIQNCHIGGFDHFGVLSQIYNGTNYTHHINLINCTFHQCAGGYGYRTSSATHTINIKVINCVAIDCVDADFGIETTHSGTLTTTGSANNSGENDTVGQRFPANTARTATDNTSPGAGDWMIFEDVTGATVDLRNALLVADSDNDAQGAGVGPASNSLVPEYDCIGNKRTGAVTDVGWHNVTAEVGILLTPDPASTGSASPAPDLDTPLELLPAAPAAGTVAPAPLLDGPAAAILLTPDPASTGTAAPAVSRSIILRPDPAVMGTAAPAVTRSITLRPDPAVIGTSAPVVTRSITLRPDPAVIGTSAPVVDRTITLRPDPAVMGTAAPAPDLDTPLRLTPDPAVTGAAAPNPSVSVDGASILLTPDPAILNLSGPDPSLRFRLTPSPAVLNLLAPPPDLDTPLRLTPDPAVLVTVAPPTAGGILITPDPAILNLSGPSPLLDVPGRRMLHAEVILANSVQHDAQLAETIESEGALAERLTNP